MIRLDLHRTRAASLALASALAFLWLAPLAHAQDADGDDDGEDQEIVVQATRSGNTLRDEPIRVDVIPQEDIEEKQMMTPGNIAMMMTESPGVRTQLTSPSLGAANIRIQGMPGRYTAFLADGLPLYGGEAPAIGLLQIPPSDLAQVEVIKGTASALYGPAALAGAVNLVSKRPGAEPEANIMLNATSRDGQDATLYAAAPIGGRWGASVTAGYNRQTEKDVGGDGWADIPGYNRWTLRPRLFWTGESGAKLLLTAGAMTERRAGGTLPGRIAPDGQPFVQTLDSDRFDAGLVGETPLASGTLQLRASAMTRRADHVFGAVIENDRSHSLFAETSFAAKSGNTSWLAGAAVQADTFHSVNFSAFDYTYVVPALFAQVEQAVSEDLTLAASARWDAHNRYRSQLSPRLSLLYKPGPLTVRASLGRGFYAPTPFVDAIEESGLSRLAPLGRLKPETAQTASLDIGYDKGPLKASLTLFGSNIRNAVRLDDIAANRVALINVPGLTHTRGAELLLRYRWQGFSLTGSYVYVDASEPAPSGAARRMVPLTPRHTASLDGMWEKRGAGRIGLELFYTGAQALEDNPYRTRSRPYFGLGAMGELMLGKVSLFVNAENLLDVRQTRYNPLLLPQRAPDGRWTVDAWAPLDGFTLNGGVRLRFGG